MRYMKKMVRIREIEEYIDFYVKKIGIEEIRRIEKEKGRLKMILIEEK